MQPELMPSTEKLEHLKQNLPVVIRTLTALVCYAPKELPPEAEISIVYEIINYLLYINEGE